MFIALEFSEQSNRLKAFADYLHKLHFPARITEQDGRLLLYVYEESHVPMVQELYRRFLQQDSDLEKLFVTNDINKDQLPWYRFPVSLLLIALSLAGFLVVSFSNLPLISALSFQGIIFADDGVLVRSADEVMQSFRSGEWWRLLTPMFLHFDIMHITFNVTVLWFLGSQIEKKEGSLAFILYVVFAGVMSNMVQYFHSPEQLFGGMSGVNYALLAYCALVNYFSKQLIYVMPVGFFIVSVVMMLLGFLGVFALIGYSIANWAHLAGFLSGAFLALVSCGLRKLNSARM